MMDYQSAVRTLSSVNTHLKLRDRCVLALTNLKRSARPVDMAKVRAAVHAAGNAVRYQQAHFPGLDNLDPASEEALFGDTHSNTPEANVVVALRRTAAHLADELRGPDPVVTGAEVDRMVEDYRGYRASLKAQNA
jgi:hypothetical protein